MPVRFMIEPSPYHCNMLMLWGDGKGGWQLQGDVENLKRWTPVTPEFFLQETDVLAKALLQLLLVHETPQGVLAGRIVETEMYRGTQDKGAHSYSGRPTKRTSVMFGPPGHAYVYFIYGMYYCLNLVTAPEGIPEAILIRALEPFAGVDLMLSRGGQGPSSTARQVARLAAGPGKLCRAMGVTKKEYGLPLWESPLYLAKPENPIAPFHIAQGPRINIGYAEEAKDYPWRFWVDGNPSVSRLR